MQRLIGFFLLTAAAACAAGDASSAAESVAAAGAPLPELDATHAARFAAGQALFHKEFTPEEGLGPLFNQRRCSSCHDLPTIGGSGVETVTKATHFDEATGCDLLNDDGGDVIQHRATPLLEALGVRREEIPPAATKIVTLEPPPLYGLGLIDAIPEDFILARADSADANGDGISGRPGRTEDGRVGRFGRRADFATLRDFVAGALILEMGLTTTVHPEEERVNGRSLPPGADPAPDPEIDDAQLALLVDYVRLLAAPARDTVPDTARDTVRRGERTFRRIGCDACHTPVLRTGRSDVPALDRRAVWLYSDLLLHDLGDDAASTCARNAGPSEFRTAPLMGLRLRPTLMQGSATIEEAVRLHGGEAARARAAFDALTAEQRAELLRWLRTL